MTLKHFAGIAAAIFGLLGAAAPVSAQPYPNRTVTIIVPYPAGGPTDQTARVVAQSMGGELKQSFVVEDISGGSNIHLEQ
jgi:tripartite-type tricarboxylate transporter receptor subunit TctC